MFCSQRTLWDDIGRSSKNNSTLGSLFFSDDEEDQNIRVETDQVIESLNDFYEDMDGYRHLYIFAYDLTRMAELLWEKVGMVEDNITAISDPSDFDI